MAVEENEDKTRKESRHSKNRGAGTRISEDSAHRVLFPSSLKRSLQFCHLVANRKNAARLSPSQPRAPQSNAQYSATSWRIEYRLFVHLAPLKRPDKGTRIRLRNELARSRSPGQEPRRYIARISMRLQIQTVANHGQYQVQKNQSAGHALSSERELTLQVTSFPTHYFKLYKLRLSLICSMGLHGRDFSSRTVYRPHVVDKGQFP